MAPIAVAVTVVIKEDMVERFLEVMKEDVVGSLERENGGCLRFDVLRDPSTPNKYMFYEMCAHAHAARACGQADARLPSGLNTIYPLLLAGMLMPTLRRGTKRPRTTRHGRSSRRMVASCHRRRSSLRPSTVAASDWPRMRVWHNGNHVHLLVLACRQLSYFCVSTVTRAADHARSRHATSAT